MTPEEAASLDGPRARVGRAAEHFDEINAVIDAFVNSDPYLLRLKRDPDGWFVSQIREITKGRPDQLGLVFGDFLHNLRSALDNLIWQLVIFNGHAPSGGTGGNAFPICSSWPRFVDSMFRLRGVSLEHVAFIEALQPYSGRNESVHKALRIVHSLSNVDKHQIVHQSIAIPAGKEVTIRKDEAADDPREGVDIGFYEREPMEVGTEISWGRVRRITEPENGEVDMEDEFPLEIALGDQVLLMRSLPEIGMEIGAIIEHFAPDLDC